MKKIIAIFIMLTIILILSACSEKITESVTIAHLAYDKYEQFGYTVYIKETDGYKPYLVLTNKYNDNTLLLRKHVLPEIHIFNPLYPNSGYKNYYENSEVDMFINIEYRETLDETIQKKIIPSTIVITAKFSGPDAHTIKIVRNIFLLSLTEIVRQRKTASLVEGIPLKYFEIAENRVAHNESEELCNWYLRTSSIYDSDTVFVMSLISEGIGSAAAYYASGVRPAFCVNGDEPITTRDDIIPGEVVYVFE